ncbi:hypothetical protein JCM30471_29310 [Desulfuromonas carbonis]|uniref:ABC transporter substrate-binding protein n=1 Tax=Desulfuromonas sp. DDH964 TaxID=1823759 RepID=UPI00078D1233|nr:ABC transporter substrate-binding protein [Desulfuromonas sp. DDH964]AMV71110.1 branched-chain amino acid ABC transporter substrate-binding lipoprotein [Desulfuromonas sp. DDH964]
MKLIRNFLLLALAIGALQIWLHQRDSDIADQRPTELSQVEQVKVALLWPFELPGKPRDLTREGAQLAAEQINAAGGIGGKPLQLVFFNNGGDTDRNAELSRKISGDPSYNALVGSYYSSLALDTLVATEAKNLFYVIIGAELPSLTGYSFQHAVRPHFNTSDYTRALAELLRCRGDKNLAIIGDQSSFSAQSAADLIKAFRDLGGNPPIQRTVPAWVRDFRHVLSEDAMATADAIYFSGSYQQLPDFVKQLREFGLRGRVYGDSSALRKETPQLLGPAGEGFEALTTFHPGEEGKTAEFVQAFVARYGTEPDLWARDTYDGIMLLAESIRATGSLEARTLFAHVRFLPDWDLVRGKISFAPDGSLEGERFYRGQIRQGAWIFPDGTVPIQSCQPPPTTPGGSKGGP